MVALFITPTRRSCYQWTYGSGLTLIARSHLCSSRCDRPGWLQHRPGWLQYRVQPDRLGLGKVAARRGGHNTGGGGVGDCPLDNQIGRLRLSDAVLGCLGQLDSAYFER